MDNDDNREAVKFAAARRAAPNRGVARSRIIVEMIFLHACGDTEFTDELLEIARSAAE